MSKDSITPEGFERILKDLFKEDETLDLDEAFAQVAVSRAYVSSSQLDECREELEKLRKEGKNFQLGELLMYLGHLNTTAFKQVLICLNRHTHYCEWCFQIYEVPESAEMVEEPPPCGKCGGPTRSPGRRGSTRNLFPKKPDLPSPIPPPSKVYRLGKYLVQREIARGGMGVVYEAEDPELKRTVALKVLRNVGASSEYIRRLHREASIGAQLQHPNIVRVYEVSMAEDAAGHQNHFIAMEYIPGQTFADVLKETPREISRLLEILADVARGMEFAHKKGVIHRDLKPPNVLIEDTGRVVLTDFGLARAESLGSQMTRTWAVMGTPEYMAPEQVEGKTAEIDQKTDVYALGVMLYEILVGSPPFTAEVPATLYQKILTEDPLRPTKVGNSIPPDLELICMKAMNRDQDSRYKNAGEFLRDLQRYLKHEPILARPSSFLYRVRKTLAKRKNITIASSLFLVILTLMGIFGFKLIKDAKENQAEKLAQHNALTKEERKEAQEQAIRDLRDRMKTALDAALEFRRDGNLKSMRKYVARAETACREALNRLPDFAEAHYRLGRIYRVVMQNDKALEQQELALKKDSDFAPALYERIVLTSWNYQANVSDLVKKAWQEQGSKLFDSLEDKKNLVLHIPSKEELVNADPEISAIEIQIKQDLLHLQDLLSRQPDIIQEEEVTLARGLYAWVTGRMTDAEEFLSQAIHLNPLLDEGYEALAQLEANRRNFEQSILWRTEGLSNDRGYLPHLEGRGLARFFWGMSEKHKMEDPISHFRLAMKDYKAATILDSERGKAWLNSALINMHWGTHLQAHGKDGTSHFETALLELEEASRRSPDLVQIGLAEGNIHMHLGLHLQQREENPEEKYQQAMTVLNKVIEEDPNHFQGWSNRATVQYYWANYWANLARPKQVEETENLFEKSIEDFGEALRLNPPLIRLWSDRGQTRLGWAEYKNYLGKNPLDLYHEAIRDFEQATRLDPKISSSVTRLAMAMGKVATYQIGKGIDPGPGYDNAMHKFHQALKLNPKNAECWGGRANIRREYALFVIFRKDKQPEKLFAHAIRDYTEALKINPSIYRYLQQRCQVRLALAQIFTRQRKTAKEVKAVLDSAQKDANELVKRKPKWYQAWSMRAAVETGIAVHRNRMGKDPSQHFQQALTDYEKSLSLNPERPATLISRANTYIKWGRIRLFKKQEAKTLFEKGIADFDSAEKINPSLVNLWGGRGVSHLYLAKIKKDSGLDPEENYKAAIKDLDQALTLLPNQPGLLSSRGNGYYEWGKHRLSVKKGALLQMKGALTDLRKAVQINPDFHAREKAKIKALEDYVYKHLNHPK